ncbi:cation:proton antiporter domain-containing protein [Staphylococcus aureus]
MMMALGFSHYDCDRRRFIYSLHLATSSIGAAFAIAAILCPTDAVAVQQSLKERSCQKEAMTILEGESLLNDAAGIISFKIAVGVLVTGAFSLVDAVQLFLNCINWWCSGWFTYRVWH